MKTFTLHHYQIFKVFKPHLQKYRIKVTKEIQLAYWKIIQIEYITMHNNNLELVNVTNKNVLR